MGSVAALRSADPRRTAGVVIAICALVVPQATLLVLMRFPRLNVVFESVDFHLVAVAAVSACAFGVALEAAVAARRTAQGALVVLAAGCLGVGAFMLAHGLTTPGTMGRPANLWVVRFPVLAIGVFALCLVIAATRADSRWLSAAARAPFAVLLGSGGLFTALSLLAMMWPQADLGTQALPGESVARSLLLAASAAALLSAGVVHWRRWRLSVDGVQLALVVASWQGVGAAISLELGETWRLAWWDYHAYLFIGFGATVYAIWRASRRRQTVHDALGSVFVTDPLAHIERGYSDALQVLVGAVEARDPYTHGHSARVAEHAVRIGERLGLRPGQLRVLAEGAYLHDVGKIGVPDRILNKPGKLDPDERAWIEQHPVVGVDIVDRAPSLRSAVDMVRYHHERYDGGGYPDGLAGERIPLLARIVAVADVYDALTSERAYRSAWGPARALAHLIEGRGSHFDPACLEAFRSLQAERGFHPDAGVGEAAVVAAASTACHHHQH